MLLAAILELGKHPCLDFHIFWPHQSERGLADSGVQWKSRKWVLSVAMIRRQWSLCSADCSIKAKLAHAELSLAALPALLIAPSPTTNKYFHLHIPSQTITCPVPIAIHHIFHCFWKPLSPSGPQLRAGGHLSLLDFVLCTLQELRPCDPRNAGYCVLCKPLDSANSHWIIQCVRRWIVC